ncbi:hypothetical protein DPSP01_014659 [Paraphaeosphaeria sporulosa]
MGVVKIGLLADFDSLITINLRQQTGSNRLLASLMDRIPVVTSLFAELALAAPVPGHSKPSISQMYLVGTIYAKLLAIGAVCLPHRGEPHGMNENGPAESRMKCGFLVIGSAFVLAWTPRLESDSWWISHGVPLFFVLHFGFSYYFGIWRAEKQHPVDKRSTNSKTNRAYESGAWAILTLILGCLKVEVVRIAHRLQHYARMIDSLPESDGTVVSLIVVPLAVAVANHSSDIRSTYRRHDSSSWLNLIQSAMQTYFFVRPLAIFAGHEIDPAGARVGIGFCFLAVALWLSLPGVPDRIKGLALISAYSYLTITCLTSSDSPDWAL